MKKSIIKAACAFMAAFLAFTAEADDTPLVQAMKVRDKIGEIQAAIAKRGVECQSFDDMPRAIGNISFINEFMNGEYSGPIVISNPNFTQKLFTDLYGKFDLVLLNMTSAQSSQFLRSPGIATLNAPKLTYIY